MVSIDFSQNFINMMIDHGMLTRNDPIIPQCHSIYNLLFEFIDSKHSQNYDMNYFNFAEYEISCVTIT